MRCSPPPAQRAHGRAGDTGAPPPPPSAEPEENPGTAGVAPVRQGNGIRWPARRRQRSGEWSQHAIQPVRQRPGKWQAGYSPLRREKMFFINLTLKSLSGHVGQARW